MAKLSTVLKSPRELFSQLSSPVKFKAVPCLRALSSAMVVFSECLPPRVSKEPAVNCSDTRKAQLYTRPTEKAMFGLQPSECAHSDHNSASVGLFLLAMDGELCAHTSLHQPSAICIANMSGAVKQRKLETPPRPHTPGHKGHGCW